MPSDGDRKLQALIARLRKLSAGSFMNDLTEKLGEEALTQVRLGFRASRNPYGEPWQDLVSRKGKPLIDTSRMRNSFVYTRVSPTSFRIGSNVEYAPHHQYGTRGRGKKGRGKIPARMMVPSKARGLGPVWTPAFFKVVRRQIAKFKRT